MTNSKKTDLLYLIDGSGYIFRAFYALPPLTRKSDGMPVGAVSGFCNMLYKFLEDAKLKDGHEKPTHIAVIFDSARKNFRNNIYPEYKANRNETPEDLIPQFSFIREAVKAFNLPSIEMENYEADDLIATYKKEALKKNIRVKIISSDKDLMQLIDDQTTLFDSMKNKDIGIEEVKEKFGVTPDKVIEVQALAGDSSDNIPGVPSIGVKTAAELINEFGSVENLLKNVDKIKQPKRRQTISDNKENALISKKLVTLKDEVPTVEKIEDFLVKDLDKKKIVSFFSTFVDSLFLFLALPFFLNLCQRFHFFQRWRESVCEPRACPSSPWRWRFARRQQREQCRFVCCRRLVRHWRLFLVFAFSNEKKLAHGDCSSTVCLAFST